MSYWRDYYVDTETGQTAVVRLSHELDSAEWVVRVSDELMESEPEAVGAAVALAFRQLMLELKAGRIDD